MSSEAAMAEIIERAFEALGLGDDQPSDDLAECIQAVRAQWAAEVDQLKCDIEETLAAANHEAEVATKAIAERDSAQAEAKRLRGRR